MKNLLERVLIKILKWLGTDLLVHAHIQIGAGLNTYVSGEENIINTVLHKALKRDPVNVFDVGANIGDYAKMIRVKFPDAKIYCFEPIDDTFKHLLANTNELNIHYENVAVGSKKGTITLFKSSNNPDGSMVTAYKDTISNVFTFVGKPDTSIECNIITIDDFCADTISSIDFLKIDVEGHELEVLKGAAKMIGENKISIIQFEFNEFNIFSRSFMHNFYEILPQYKFYRIMPQNKLYPLGEYTPAHEIFRYQNILAINNSLSYDYQS